MHQLQLENNNLQESIQKLQARIPMELEEEKTNFPFSATNFLPIEPGLSSTLFPSPLHPTTSLKPKVSFLDKFDGTRVRF
jgi:hypothetical protein